MSADQLPPARQQLPPAQLWLPMRAAAGWPGHCWLPVLQRCCLCRCSFCLPPCLAAATLGRQQRYLPAFRLLS